MKAKALATSTSSWPAGVPFFDPARQPQESSAARSPRQASVGPIELRIDGNGGPSAIAILE
ncbi:MAG: hypothetical protein ACE5EG_06965 [Thermoanaerobaculia bacterium]